MAEKARDKVRLEIDGEDVERVEAFSIEMDTFQTPCRFSLTLGGARFRDLRRKYQPNRKFKLWVDDDLGSQTVVFSGKTDSLGCSGAADGKTTILLRGRDHLSQLESQAPADKGYGGAYEDIVRAAIKDAFDQLDEPPVGGLVIDSPKGWAKKAPAQAPTMKGGSSYFCFLKNILCKTPLVLGWDATAGVYKLYEPRLVGQPAGHIIHRQDLSNIESFNYDFDITGRACEIICYGRATKKNAGRQLSSFNLVDQELFSLGVRKRAVMVDKQTTSPEEAEYHALRNQAAARRDGWSLQYSVQGLTTGGKPWLHNSVVSVVDEELEIDRHLYLESVTMSGENDRTRTTLKVTRPEDLEILAMQEHRLLDLKTGKTQVVRR